MEQNESNDMDNDMSDKKYTCGKCSMVFSRKYNLTRHQKSDKCGKKQNENIDSILLMENPFKQPNDESLISPSEAKNIPKLYEDVEICDPGMSCLLARQRDDSMYTPFKKLFPNHARYTPYITKNYEEGKCKKIVIDEYKGDLIGALYITVSIKVFDKIATVTYNDTIVLQMKIGELYHLSRVYNLQNKTDDLININIFELFVGQGQYLFVGGKNKLQIVGDFEGYSAEIACCASTQLNQYMRLANETMVIGYHVLDIENEAEIRTRYPVIDILATSKDKNKITFMIENKFEQQLLSDTSGLVKSFMTDNITDDKIYYFTSNLHIITKLTIHDGCSWGGWIIPSTIHFDANKPCRIIIRYVTFLRTEGYDSYFHCGLTNESRPYKEVLTAQILKAYKAKEPIPEVNPTLLIKKCKEICGGMTYYENTYFSTCPTECKCPIKVPTDKKVPKDIIKMINLLMKHPKIQKNQIFTGILCPLLDKLWRIYYTFTIDDICYNFNELLPDECSILNIHPSAQFVDAMKKFLDSEKESDDKNDE
jgi:hypothetical protein